MDPMKHVTGSLGLTFAVVTALSIVAIAIVVGFFGLGIFGGTALYFVIWWTLLFVTLPIGVRSQQESGEVVHGSEPGAPSAPNLRLKAIWTTIISGAVLVFAAWAFPLAGL
ncbi:DUF1467 family protein [Salinarimonas soli]|uniref:DUF1467 family protein n=1 Tax=Salinarimonas soli TaxID=1638099 RepID=A0A5B2VXC6_9HYPH|nr:DUF1467 family protein [Salinarimonas soli]KAA2243991.1 DUF1467 family protein [Salinarimonas soli]